MRARRARLDDLRDGWLHFLDVHTGEEEEKSGASIHAELDAGGAEAKASQGGGCELPCAEEAGVNKGVGCADEPMAMVAHAYEVPRAKRAEGLTDDVVKVRKEWHAHSV